MKAVRWEDTKRQVRELNPDRDTPERVASRERGRAAMRAEQRGYQLAQLRKNTGLVGIPRPAALLVSFDTPGARAQALVHAPAALRRRGVFVADYEIDAA